MFEIIKHAIEYFAGIDNGVTVSYDLQKYDMWEGTDWAGTEPEITIIWVTYSEFELKHWTEQNKLKWEFFINWLDNYWLLHDDGRRDYPGRFYNFNKENFQLDISRDL